MNSENSKCDLDPNELPSEVDRVITGPELDAMSDEELARRIGNVSIFARAGPEQKLRYRKPEQIER